MQIFIFQLAIYAKKHQNFFCGGNLVNYFNSPEEKQLIKQKSYVNIAKKNRVKPAVIIGPKETVGKKLRKEIFNKVDKSTVNICSARYSCDGGVVLSRENADEMKKQLFDEKIANAMQYCQS